MVSVIQIAYAVILALLILTLLVIILAFVVRRRRNTTRNPGPSAPAEPLSSSERLLDGKSA